MIAVHRDPIQLQRSCEHAVDLFFFSLCIHNNYIPLVNNQDFPAFFPALKVCCYWLTNRTHLVSQIRKNKATNERQIPTSKANPSIWAGFTAFICPANHESGESGSTPLSDLFPSISATGRGAARRASLFSYPSNLIKQH